MPKISLIVRLTAVDGKQAELEDAIRRVVGQADEEEGPEVYSAHAVDEEPGAFDFFGLYRDDEAKSAHGRGERMREAMGSFAGLLAGRPEITRMTPVAAKGLDL